MSNYPPLNRTVHGVLTGNITIAMSVRGERETERLLTLSTHSDSFRFGSAEPGPDVGVVKKSGMILPS